MRRRDGATVRDLVAGDRPSRRNAWRFSRSGFGTRRDAPPAGIERQPGDSAMIAASLHLRTNKFGRSWRVAGLSSRPISYFESASWTHVTMLLPG